MGRWPRPVTRPSLPPSVRPQLYRRDYPSHLNQIWYGHVSGSGHSSLVTEYHVGQRSRSSQGHRSLLVFWLLCKDLSSNSYQTWYNVCLYYCPLIYDHEIKVIHRSKDILVFWPLWPYFFTDFHQNWDGTYVNHGKSFCDLHYEWPWGQGHSKVKGHRRFRAILS